LFAGYRDDGGPSIPRHRRKFSYAKSSVRCPVKVPGIADKEFVSKAEAYDDCSAEWKDVGNQSAAPVSARRQAVNERNSQLE
jgi:hypothetical protein